MRHRQDGFILLSILISTTFIMVIGVISLQLIGANLQSAKKERYTINAQFAADAGIDDAVRQLNLDNAWTGSSGEITLATSTDFKSTYETSVVDGANDSQKFINVTARTYVPANATTAKSTRKYQVEMRGITSGDYSVVTGVGGLVMSNSSKIVGGSVYVNGTITLNNSAQIGLSTKPITVRSAHQSCPNPATASYPTVCGAGENGQPIVINGTNAHIYGDVQGTNQTDGAKMSLPGLQTGSPTPSALPTHNRAAQISAVTSTLTGNFSCTNGSYVWPANYRITGNVSISNKCEVTVSGNVWVEGNLDMRNSQSKMIVSNALGTTQPDIMVDGSTGLTMDNSTVMQSNSQNTGFRIITYWSTASCSPSCSNVTGTDLYNSRSRTTISLANSASGPNTQFYAKWTQIDINNSGNIGALVGQTVNISNSGAITFGASVSGAGGIEAWVVKSYKRTF